MHRLSGRLVFHVKHTEGWPSGIVTRVRPQKVDEDAQLARHPRRAWEIEMKAIHRRTPRLEHSNQAAGRHMLGNEVFQHVRQAHALLRRLDHRQHIIGDEAPVTSAD